MSFELGSIHGITGRSGVGKTTLLKILAMIMPPDSGMYYYGEKQVDIPYGDSFLDTRAGIKKVQDEYNIPLILLSLGKVGSRAYLKNNIIDVKAEMPAFVREDTIETTGAGDTVGGCCLHYVLGHCPEGTDINDVDWTAGDLKEMLTFANKAASIITTRKGALAVMPTIEEIENEKEL